ncbi:MAG: GNAT family N-acetyltransferase [Candidatus Asgardarchaeia archaeon]
MSKSEKFEVKHSKTSRWFYIRLGRGKAAYLKYSINGNVMSLDSTYTPEEFRGRGIAKRLMEEAIKYAKENGLKIKPVCSYAVHFFKKYPQYKEILA